MNKVGNTYYICILLFSSVFTEEDIGLKPESHFSEMQSGKLSQREMMRNEVLKLTAKLKDNKSLDPDGIHHKVLKELKCKIANLLT